MSTPNSSNAEDKTLEDLSAQKAGQILNYDDLLEGRPEAQRIHVASMVPTSAEMEEKMPITAKVWVPGLKDPETGKLGITCIVRKPSPDEEITIYAKSREKGIPEEIKLYLKPEHIPASGRAYRFECIWKMVYCCEAPTVSFDWACKIMSLKYGAFIVKPLIDRIDELMAIRRPIDELTDNSIFAYPTFFGDAKIAARDGKLTEYFASVEESVARTIRDNAKTMLLIQLEVAKENAELSAAIAELVRREFDKGEYEPSPVVAAALRNAPDSAAVARLTKAAHTAPEPK